MSNKEQTVIIKTTISTCSFKPVIQCTQTRIKQYHLSMTDEVMDGMDGAATRPVFTVNDAERLHNIAHLQSFTKKT